MNTRIKVSVEYEIQVGEKGIIPSEVELEEALRNHCSNVLGYGMNQVWKIDHDSVKVKAKRL